MKADAPGLARILCVDDEPDIRFIAKLALEIRGGFVVTMAGSGADALRDVAAVEPQLILLDVMMPDMDGRETFARLRATASAAYTPIVFLTAKTETSDVSALLSLGAIAVLRKPFDPRSLADEVAAIWRSLHRSGV